MNLAARFAPDERIRLFCALRLPEEVLDSVVEWQGQVDWPEAVRIVPRGNLHVTLAFLGSRPASELDAIACALRRVASRAGRIQFAPAKRKLRETRSVGMVALHDLDGGAKALAEDLHVQLQRLGVYEPERRPWLPHLTVVRFSKRPGLELDPPAVGFFSPSDAAVYHSLLRRDGAQYEALESVPLGG